MAGTLTIDQLKASSGVLATQNGMTGICKAWVNFGYVSSAITVRGSFNVSSVTRNTTATYTVNYTTAMPNANYAAVVGVLGDSSPYNQPLIVDLASYTASSMKVFNSPDYSITAVDTALMTVIVCSS